jgi:hypothetical protein
VCANSSRVPQRIELSLRIRHDTKVWRSKLCAQRVRQPLRMDGANLIRA